MKPKLLNILSIIDIDANTIEEGVKKELSGLCEYKDQTMKEDIYSIDLNEQHEVSLRLKIFLKVVRNLNLTASYFRIITP